MSRQIYNFFDNCGPGNQATLDASASSSTEGNFATFSELRARFADGPANGGQSYPCGTGHATTTWCNDPAVREGIHMKPESFYGRPWSLQAGQGMSYDHYTGASFDLYPDIIKHTRVLIYNGDGE